MNNEMPKKLYHGSRFKIDDGFIRARPGHINGMKTEITATFATSDFAHARLYAVMRLIASGWKSPNGSDTLYVENIIKDIPEKAYVYELDSNGFNHDQDDEYYCLTDKPIKNVVEIDIMKEIKKGNIKVYVLKEKIDFASMPRQESMELWRKTLRQRDKFELYKPDIANISVLAMKKNQGYDK